jgi:hypothetical protein
MDIQSIVRQHVIEGEPIEKSMIRQEVKLQLTNFSQSCLLRETKCVKNDQLNFDYQSILITIDDTAVHKEVILSNDHKGYQF